MTPEKASVVVEYVNQHLANLRAKPPKSLVDFPPPLVRQIAQCFQDIIDNPERYPEHNIAILKLSTPIEWAAELYSHMTEQCKALCMRKSAPEDLADYQTEILSNSMSVYLSYVDKKFYTGSGTQVSGSKSTGGRVRQQSRGVTRKKTNNWHGAILDAAGKGLHAQWVQAIEIRVRQIDKTTKQEVFVGTHEINDQILLKHYRVLVKLGEQAFGCLLGSHRLGAQFDHLLWPVTWKRYSPWPAFQEPILDVLTKEVRNAKLHVENLTVEQHEAKLKRSRVGGMSEEAHQRNNNRSRVENMTEEQHDSKLKRHRVDYLAPEKHEAKKKKARVESMTTEQREEKNKKTLVKNLTPAQHEAKLRVNREYRARKKAERLALEEKTESEMNKMNTNATGS
jgi:hypothetical protein